MLGELGWRSMLWRHVHALLRWHIHAWLWTWCSVGRATHARMLGRTTRLVKEPKQLQFKLTSLQKAFNENKKFEKPIP